MVKTRRLIKPVNYSFAIEESKMVKLKKLIEPKPINLPSLLRTLIDEYIDNSETIEMHVKTHADIVRGIKDQVDVLLVDNSFKLNELVSLDARQLVKDLRSFHVAYIHGGVPRKYQIPIGYGEYINVRFGDDYSATITSTAHNIVIRQKGYFVYIDMPRSYAIEKDEHLKFNMVNNLVITIQQMTINYKDNMLINIGNHESAKQPITL